MPLLKSGFGLKITWLGMVLSYAQIVYYSVQIRLICTE
jgi:hypothetical protein